MKSEDKLFLGIIIGFIIFYYFGKLRNKFKKKKIYNKAKKAEKNAMLLLENEKYKILEIQPKKDIFYYQNDELKKGYVNADFLVRKKFKKMVCEVKTGEKTRVSQAVVRRQLLDYYYAFRVSEVLLIDMEKERIDRIRFRNEKDKSKYLFLIVIFLANLLYIFYEVKK